MTRTALSRADLVRLAVSLDDPDLARLAEGLGYRAVEQPRPASHRFSEPTREQATVEPSPPVATIDQYRAYRLTERHQLTPPERQTSPPTPHRLDAESGEPEPLPPPPPLVPWSRLWPLLRAALSELAERQRVDVPRLVAAQARLRPLRRLPRRKAVRWAPVGQLIIDLSPRLYPFWGDFAAIKALAPRLRGRTGLEILGMEQGPEGAVRAWDGEDWGAPRAYRAPTAEVPILILGDLGCLGTAAKRDGWVRLGRQLRARGRQAVVLTPCPPRWWDPALAGCYFPVVLDRAAHIPTHPVGACPWPAQAVEPHEAIVKDPGASRLLALLDASLAISPALLRHLRHWLPAGEVDVGSEAAAWQHPARQAGAFALLPGTPAASEQLQRRVSSTLDATARQHAWALIQAQQTAQGASRAVRMEERIRQAALLGETDPQAETFQDEVATALETARSQENRDQERFLTGWVGRVGARMTPSAWGLSSRSEALWLLANPEATTDGAALPSGFDIHRALAGQNRAESERRWRILQRGKSLEIVPDAEAETPFLSGSLVAGGFYSADPVAQVREDRPEAPTFSLPLRECSRLPLYEHGWRIRTEREELVIGSLRRPIWAHTLGRDQDGLFVGFDDGLGDRRAYWCAPGQAFSEWLESLRIQSGVDLLTLSPDTAQGFFIDQAQLRAFREQGMPPAHLGISIQTDGYGIRGEIHIKGIPIALRWIWPGEFVMGSPEDEEGRFDNERQHLVILTRGFWLAETACTQALWEAVMGENPSYNKGEEHPVENVSWEDIQGLLKRLNAELAAAQAADRSTTSDSTARPPGSIKIASSAQDTGNAVLRFRLPTEAEWEYACRAGTTTAYSFGDAFDAKRANNGDQTVPVRSLPPNSWGLYEMHGNVWEWCQDWDADYAGGPMLDPVGPATGEYRVLRGGSWINVARDLRSASRLHGDPGSRSANSGFRFALGPEFRQAENGKPARSETGQSAQGASRSERKARAVRSRGASRKDAP